MKKIFLLLFCAITINCVAQNVVVNAIYTSPKTDSLPSFTEDPYYLNQFIMNNFKASFLVKSQQNYSFGSLTISFQIDSIGNVSDVNFLNSKNVYVENEILRIFNIMPNWKPGYNNGYPVTTSVYLPISYTIKDNIFEIINTSSKTVKITKSSNKVLRISIVAVCVAIMWFSFFNR